MEVEIGRGKKGRRAYGFDDIAIVPSRRTRDPDDIDITSMIGPYRLELPLLASAMDGVVSPETAGILGKLGGLGVLNLEGIWTRYEDAGEQLERIAQQPKELATSEMQRIYAEPIKEELIGQRIREIKDQGVVAAASLTPQRVRKYYEAALEAGLDILVIQGTVVSAEHVSANTEPLNLKEFIREVPVPVIVGGCASYATGLHLMRTGAEAVLVGVGPGAACTTRGVLGIGVPLARAYEAPGRGYHWGMATFHPSLPRGARVKTTQNGTLEQILLGPAHENDGTFNLMGSLRTSMATCGYEDIPSFHRAEGRVAPSRQTEGKQLQRDQAIGMGAVSAAKAAPAPDGVVNGGATPTSDDVATPTTDPALVGD